MIYAPKAAEPRMGQGLGRIDVLDQIRVLNNESESLVQQLELLQHFQGKMMEIMDTADAQTLELEAEMKALNDLALVLLQSQQPACRNKSPVVGPEGPSSPAWTSMPTPSEVGDWPRHQCWATEGNEAPIPDPAAQGAQAGTAAATVNPVFSPHTLATLSGASSASGTVTCGATMASPMTLWQLQAAAASLDWEDCD